MGVYFECFVLLQNTIRMPGRRAGGGGGGDRYASALPELHRDLGKAGWLDSVVAKTYVPVCACVRVTLSLRRTKTPFCAGNQVEQRGFLLDLASPWYNSCQDEVNASRVECMVVVHPTDPSLDDVELSFPEQESGNKVTHFIDRCCVLFFLALL